MYLFRNASTLQEADYLGKPQASHTLAARMDRDGDGSVQAPQAAQASSGLASDSAQRRFAAWLASSSGNRLLDVERPLIRDAARRFHGDALLWVGPRPDLLDTTSISMVRARVFAALDPSGACPAVSDEQSDHSGTCAFKTVVADPAQLPFGSSSVDAIVLHHVLDVMRDRRGALREAARVLSPGGRLVVLGFNPLSLWLLAKPRRALLDLKPVSVPRLNDWLALLGLERETRTVYLNYRSALPLALEGDRWRAASGWLNRLQLPVGGVYLVVARKVGHAFILQGRRVAGHRREPTTAVVPNPTRITTFANTDWCRSAQAPAVCR